MHRSYGYHHSGSSFLLNTLFLLSICAIAGCLFYGRGYDEPDVVVIQQGPGGVLTPGENRERRERNGQGSPE